MVYTVGQVAKELGIAPSALRYYDQEGLLPFVRRSEAGVRVFTESDLRWLKMISCLKSAGMPIKSIRRYVESAMKGDSTIDERLQMIYQQRERVMEQMRELQRTLDVVEYKCWYYETAKKAGTEQVMRSMSETDVPEKFRPVIGYLHGEKK